MGRRVGACLSLAALVIAGCGDDPQSPPDGARISSLVTRFFEDAAGGDAEAICSVLTPNGRAWAVGRTFSIHRGESMAAAPPRRPASYEQCVESGAPHATGSSDLPHAMKNGFRPQVVKTRRSPEGVRVRVKFTAVGRTWVMRRSADGWRIHYFSLPVRE
jgi:hypothetical protein